MFRTRKARIWLTVLGAFLFYLMGVVVRSKYGLHVVVRNESGEVLHEVSLKVEYRGKLYELPNLAPGERAGAFVNPVGKSHVNLGFTDPRNVRHVETVVGYISDNCGRVTATINPGNKVDSTDSNAALSLVCWKSWFGFV